MMSIEPTSLSYAEYTEPDGLGSGTPAIAARQLRRTFKGGIEAVRDIDLTVARYDRT
jgi:hypothetical protein